MDERQGQRIHCSISGALAKIGKSVFLKNQNFTVLCSLVLLKMWVGQKVHLVLNTNKTHFSFSPEREPNELFGLNTLLLP